MPLEILIAGFLGILGTLAGIFVTYFLEERKERRRTKVEEWKTVVDEVYSPMIFDLMSFRKGLLASLEAIDKTFAESSTKFTESQIIDSLTLIASITARFKQSYVLEDILKKKSRLIRPVTLWLDLNLFHSYLDEIEDIFSIISTGRFRGSYDKLLNAVHNCINIGKKLEEAASHIRVHVGKIVVSTEEMAKSLSYTPFFTKEIIDKLEEQHESLLKVLTPGK